MTELQTDKDFFIFVVQNGLSRIIYRARNKRLQNVFYCLQDEGKGYGGINCYRCTNELEPDYQVQYARNRFEVPTGDSEIEVVVRDYIQKKR